jgi:hypothetical protein
MQIETDQAALLRLQRKQKEAEVYQMHVIILFLFEMGKLFDQRVTKNLIRKSL